MKLYHGTAMSTHMEPAEIIEPAAPTALAQLRAELDAIDDQIHDLLMHRASVIERVARDGGKTGAKIRPGREASMLRRLLKRHTGSMPPQIIVRFWREMFAGALIIEGGQTVAVCSGDDNADLAGIATRPRPWPISKPEPPRWRCCRLGAMSRMAAGGPR
jgi:chorismate mutase